MKIISKVPVDIQRYIMKMIVQDCTLLVYQVFAHFSKIYLSHISRIELRRCDYNTTHDCISCLVSLYDYTKSMNVKFSSRAVRVIYSITDYVYQNFERYHSNKYYYCSLSNCFQSLSLKLYREDKCFLNLDEEENIEFYYDVCCELSNIKI